MNRSAAWSESGSWAMTLQTSWLMSLSDTTSSHHNFPVHSLSSWATTTASTALTTASTAALTTAVTEGNREIWRGCYAARWCHGQLDISPFQNIACLGSQTIVEIQGASDLLKLLTSFTIQNLLASLAHNQLTDCTRGTQRQCKNWFRIGAAK